MAMTSFHQSATKLLALMHCWPQHEGLRPDLRPHAVCTKPKLCKAIKTLRHYTKPELKAMKTRLGCV